MNFEPLNNARGIVRFCAKVAMRQIAQNGYCTMTSEVLELLKESECLKSYEIIETMRVESMVDDKLLLKKYIVAAELTESGYVYIL